MPDIKATAAGVLCRAKDGSVLFLKRGVGGDHAGEWCLPGGGCEPGEFGEDAARRELLEETGYAADDLTPLHRGTSDEGVDYSTYLHNVAGKFSPTLNDEHTEHVWADPAEPPQPLHPGLASMMLANDAEFNEGDHPRAAGGKFGSGSGGSSGGTSKGVVNNPNPKTAAAHAKINAASSDPSLEGAEKAQGIEKKLLGSGFKASHKDSGATADYSRKVFEKDGKKTAVIKNHNTGEVSVSDWPPPAEKAKAAAGGGSNTTPHQAISGFEKEHGGSTAKMKTALESKSHEHLQTALKVIEKHGSTDPTSTKVKKLIESELDSRANRGTTRGHGEPDQPIKGARDSANDWAGVAARLGILPQPALAEDWAGTLTPRPPELAFDKASVRTYDANGRLRIEQANISKANVCGYLGSEIANAAELGLEPKRVYQLLRDPEALALAASTFNGVPLLDTHVPSTAWDHPFGKVVGTTGTDAVFEAPYLKNSLVVWTQDAIDGIESREQQELSSSYAYRAVMEPGNHEGVKYDGRMVDILGNHVALVAAGRAGPDVIVGDSQLKEVKETGMTKKALSPMAQLVRGAMLAALTPVLAKDAKLDLNSVLGGVTKKNFAAEKPRIIAAIRPKLAADAELGDIVQLLDTLEKAEGMDETPPVDETPGMDSDPGKMIMDMLKGKGASDEEMGQAGELLKKLKPATDADPDEEERKRKEAAAGQDGEEPKVTKTAMDAAISQTAKETEQRTVARLNGIAEARDKVQPYVGKLSIAFDSAEQVYRAALKQLGVAGADTIHASALPAVLEAQPRPDARRADKALAMDGAAQKSFAETFPTVAAVRHA